MSPSISPAFARPNVTDHVEDSSVSIRILVVVVDDDGGGFHAFAVVATSSVVAPASTRVVVDEPIVVVVQPSFSESCVLQLGSRSF